MTGTQVEPEEKFASWAFATIMRLRRAIGIGFIIITTISISVHLFINGTGGEIGLSERTALAYIQTVACLLLALLTPKEASTYALAHRKGGGIDESDLETAKIACKRIQILVVATYIAWAIYYLITALSMKESLTLFDRASLVTLNTLPSVLLFWLYIELAEFTVDEQGVGGEVRESKAKAGDEPAKSDGEISHHSISFRWFTLSVDVGKPVADSNAAFLHLFSLGLFALLIVPVWYAWGSNQAAIIDTFDGLASCFNGVALALVVGRLGSKNIDPGSLTLGLLYFYAVIQPTAASFYKDVKVQLLATTIALPLKALLWLVFVWAFTTGVLAEYVHDIRILLARQHRDGQTKAHGENIS